ncbi:YopX family protein [Levilactobacillus brevis]|uniref:YopX family protein n=2 Tax=Levilactobacillus brevis TaxID=1580 RepID=UPI0009BB49BD
MMVPKFRAWHMPFGPKGPIQEMVHGKASSILAFAEMSPDEYIVEQYTGVKDESDVDIYEGDIVRVSDVYGDLSYIDVIWGGSDRYPAFDIKNHSKYYDSNALLSIVNGGFEIIEVIGNVHTNPELLEAQHG